MTRPSDDEGVRVDAVDRAQARVDDLRALLRDVQRAAGRVPALTRAAGAVGRPGSWTGAAASTLHRDELAPAATRLPKALDRVEQAVRDELTHAERSLRTATDEAAKDKARQDASS